MKDKVIAYPNLLETLGAVVDSHQDIHSTIAEHAQTHTATIAAKRSALSIKQDADRLMRTEVEQ